MPHPPFSDRNGINRRPQGKIPDVSTPRLYSEEPQKRKVGREALSMLRSKPRYGALLTTKTVVIYALLLFFICLGAYSSLSRTKRSEQPIIMVASSSLRGDNATIIGDSKDNNVYQVRMLIGGKQDEVIIEVHRDWAPLGADRFHELVNNKFYDKCKFFRVIKNFMAQFGIAADPKVNAKYQSKSIMDDPVRQSNSRGFISFATSGPNTRTAQLFINYSDNKFLDGQGFAPFGKVISGMNYLDELYPKYGENPDQALTHSLAHSLTCSLTHSGKHQS